MLGTKRKTEKINSRITKAIGIKLDLMARNFYIYF